MLLGYSQTTRPADRAAGERLRRLRRVDAGGVGQRGLRGSFVRPPEAGTTHRPAFARRHLRRQPRVPGRVIIAVLAIAVWGSRRVAVAELTRAGEPIRVGIVQGNVDQAEKMEARTRCRDLPGLPEHDASGDSRRGASSSSGPSRRRRSGSRTIRWRAAQIRTLARQARVPILFGSDQFVHDAAGRPTTFYNSAFLVRPGRHDRRRLSQDAPGAVRRVRAGQEAAVLRRAAGRSGVGLLGRDRGGAAAGRGHRVSTAICYEVVYPDLVRRFVAGGSELLTTITNDAWFGRTSAPYQHFEQAAMRAIEEGRYLVRSANTGISGIVDPYGRVLARRRHLRAGRPRRRRPLPDDVDVLRAARRRPRVRVGPGDGRVPRAVATAGLTSSHPTKTAHEMHETKSGRRPRKAKAFGFVVKLRRRVK